MLERNRSRAQRHPMIRGHRALMGEGSATWLPMFWPQVRCVRIDKIRMLKVNSIIYSTGLIPLIHSAPDHSPNLLTLLPETPLTSNLDFNTVVPFACWLQFKVTKGPACPSVLLSVGLKRLDWRALICRCESSYIYMKSSLFHRIPRFSICLELNPSWAERPLRSWRTVTWFPTDTSFLACVSHSSTRFWTLSQQRAWHLLSLDYIRVRAEGSVPTANGIS
jgi:hypothetical protein